MDREKIEKKAKWLEIIPKQIREPVLMTIAMIFVVIIFFGLIFAGAKINNEYHGWKLSDGSIYHDRASVLFPAQLEIINLGKDSLVLEVDSTKVEINSRIEEGKQIQTVKFPEPGNYTVWVNSDPVAVRVFASASEIGAQKEPGFESLAAISAFAIIFAIRRSRAGG